MARVTVDDCLDKVDNRFDLVLIASKRARQLANGQEPGVSWDNDKPTVVALREIAAGLVDKSVLDEVTAREHGEESIVDEAEIGVDELVKNAGDGVTVEPTDQAVPE